MTPTQEPTHDEPDAPGTGAGRFMANAFPARPILPLRDRILRWAMRASVLAAAFSVAAHLAVWVVTGYWGVSYGQIGGGSAPTGDVELAIETGGDLGSPGDGSVEVAAPSVPELSGGDPQVGELMNGSPGDDLPSATEAIGDVGPMAGGGDVGSGIGSGLGGGGGGGGGGASFFGVEARGTRFAFIVDVSGSMQANGKIEALRQELTQSISALADNAHFFVVLFSTDAKVLGGRTTWQPAGAPGKRWARGLIETISADGNTVPFPAFQIVLGMRPRPDAIYFMTDGEFDEGLVDQLKLMNRGVRVAIHCICFETRESEAHMKRIAKDSGGTYTFVPGPGSK